MYPLEIRLLGPTIVRRNGELISIQRRLPRGLLFYMAAQGNMIPRDTILEMFWGERISQNRPRLNENLSRLRAALPDTDIIISYDGFIGINFEKVFVDLLHFQDLLDQAGRTPWQIPDNEPLPNNIFQLLNEANDLWRGPCAMEGINFPTSKLDDWLQATTEHLHNARFNILTRLSDHAYVLQDLQTSLDLARSALRYDSFNEEYQYKVMRNLIKLGQIQEARQYFEDTQQMMRDELGISPSPQMIHLYQSVRNQDQPLQPFIEPKWEIHPSVDVPFVGRKNALFEINRAIDEKRGIVILGESGQGKSRLVQEYISQLQPQPRVLITICRPAENSLPFHPIIELFRRYVSPDEWLSLPKIWAEHLTGLLPEITQMRSDLAQVQLSYDMEQTRAKILESIRQVFELMAKDHPLFFVIEDAHWADEATLSTLAYLIVREPFTLKASMAIIARLEEMNVSLRSMVNSIQQSKHARVYELNNLHRDDITVLTNHLLNSLPPSQFVDRLINESGGNTFFVLEILRAMLETETHYVSLDVKLPVTKNLQSLITSRLEKLSSKARETLEVAAIIGSEFSIQILSKSSHQSLEELNPLFEELEKNLLIAPFERRKGEFYYRFTHDKIRETLRYQMSPAKSQMIHAWVVNALTLSQASEAGVLAHHYSGAGQLKMAFHYWLEAANHARSLFAEEDASHNYAKAEQLLQQIEYDLSDDEIYQLYADWNDLAYNLTKTELLNKIGNELIQLGKNRDSHLLIGTGFDALSDACMTANDFNMGLEYASQALTHLELSTNTFELIEAYNHQGTFLYMLNRLEEALVSFQDALALSTVHFDQKICKATSNAHYQIALLQVLFGNPARGYEHGVRALEIAERCQHSYSIIQAFGIKALASFYMGELTRSREEALAGIILAERTQGWRMLGYLHSYAGLAEIALGYIDSGKKHAEEAIQLGEKFGHQEIVALGCRSLGELNRLLFDYDRANQYHQRGFDGAKEHFLGLDNLYRLGLVEYFQDQESGEEKILLASNVLEESSVYVGSITAKVCLGIRSATLKEWQKTEQLATEIEAETLTGGLASFHAIGILLLGEVAFARGDYETATEHFRFVAGEARCMKNPWLEIKAEACIEKTLASQNKDTSASKERIATLLRQLESQVILPKTRDKFTNFYQQVANRTWMATETL